MSTKYSMPKLAVAIAAMIALTGCKDAMEQLNRDLAAANASMAGTRTASRPGTMARMEESTKGQQTQLVVPTETRTRDAMEAALPMIKKVLSIHQCIKMTEGLLQLNSFALPGVDMSRQGMYPNHQMFMKHHDRNKCVSVRSIDNWAMPALNALQFRAVYFADDSGETVNFRYLLKKSDDGSWRIQEFLPSRD